MFSVIYTAVNSEDSELQFIVALNIVAVVFVILCLFLINFPGEEISMAWFTIILGAIYMAMLFCSFLINNPPNK